jgi:hypothetical protein
VLAVRAAWSCPSGAERATRRHEESKAAVKELYEEWETAQRDAEGAAT